MPTAFQPKSGEPFTREQLRERLATDARAVPTAHRAYAEKADGQIEFRLFTSQAAHHATGIPPVAEGDTLSAQFAAAGVEYVKGYEDRIRRYIASTQEPLVDYADVVMQNWDMKVFARNPVMPYNHDWATTIGAHMAYGVVQVQAGEYNGPALYTHAFFAPAEVSELADQKFRLVAAGLLKGISASWYPLETLDVKDPDERNRMGLGQFGIVFSKNKLIEISPTPLPRVSSGLLQASAYRDAKEGNLRENDLDLLIATVAQFASEFVPASLRDKEIDEARGVAAALFPNRSFARVAYSVPGRIENTAIPPNVNSGSGGDGADRFAALEAKIDALGRLIAEQHSAITATLPRIGASMTDVRSIVEDKLHVLFSANRSETAQSDGSANASAAGLSEAEVRAANILKLQQAFAQQTS